MAGVSKDESVVPVNPLETASKGSVGSRIASNASLLLGAKVLATLMGIGTVLIAVNSLTAAEFGTIVFLHAYMLFFAEVATFQSWQAMIRFGADDLEEGNTGRLIRLLKFGYKLDLISVVFGYLLAIIAFEAVVYVARMIPGDGVTEGLPLDTLQLYVTLYCLVILARCTSTSIGIFRLFDKYSVLGVEALVMPIVRFAGAAFVAWKGYGLPGFAVAWFLGSFCQYMFLFFAGLLELRQRGLLVKVMRAKASFLRPERSLWPFVIKSNIDATLATGFMHLPQILVMAVFGPIWNGVFKIAEEVAKLLTEGFKLLDQVIYPELAKLVTSRQTEKIWRIVTRAAFILLAVGLAFSALIFLFGRPILVGVFGPSYGDAVPLAMLLVPAAALMGAAAPLYPIFYATDRPERAIWIRGSALLIYIATFLITAFTIGRLAPGWAALVSNAFAVIVLAIAAKRTLNSTVKWQADAFDDDALPEK